MPVFVLLCWCLAVRHVGLEWTLNEQYHYGWVVPLLALYLGRLRLEGLPMPKPVRSGWIVQAGLLLIALAEVVVLPVQEANVDWRLLGAVLTALAVGATLLALYQAGGLPWVGHLAFPVLFTFTAVPWPRQLEFDLMQGLMLHNAQLAAEGLRWLGVMAEVQGSLIQLSTHVVDIDEACSGIRSLQGALMATLFVGEIFDLGRGRRLALLLIGAAWALVTNAGRTLFLALVTERAGLAGYDQWHDSAGLGVLAVCVAGVVLAGWLLRRLRPALPQRPVLPNSARACADRWQAVSRTVLVSTLLIGAGWLATEGWYRSRNAGVVTRVTWEFLPPGHAPEFVTLEQASRVRSDLRYDFHAGGRWVDEDGRQWVGHFFRWDAGKRDAMAALSHDPRHCLGATGKELVEVLPVAEVRVGGVVLPFDAFWFRDQAGEVFVFNTMLEDVRYAPGQGPELGRSLEMKSRLAAAWAGRRNPGMRRLEVAVWGARDATTARLAFEHLLREQVRVSITGAAEGGAPPAITNSRQ